MIVNTEDDLEKGVRPPPASSSFIMSLMSSGPHIKPEKPKRDPKVVKQKQFDSAKETIKNFVQMSSFRGPVGPSLN